MTERGYPVRVTTKSVVEQQNNQFNFFDSFSQSQKNNNNREEIQMLTMSNKI